jgi:hypothetical protein
MKCSGNATVTGTFADEDACLTACAAQENWDLACRQNHLNMAAQDDALHCPHTVGVDQCADM